MKQMKKWIAALLALAITMSLAACGAPAAQKESAQSNKIPEKVEDMDREDKELIADLIGGKDGSDLTDEELDELIKDLIGETEDTSGIVNLGNKPQDKKPTVDTTDAEGVYNEDGAMTVPFDQAYPEAIEQNQVQFSGESILIKLESDKLTSGLKKAGIGALQQIVPLKGAAWYEAKLTQGTDPKKALAAVRELDEVLLAEYNYEIKTAALDDYKHFDKDKDEEFKKNGHNKDQWHFHHCGIVDGYEEMEKDGGDSSVIVAVIDSGVDYDHEDLKDNMWVNAKEIPDNGRDDDGNGYIDDYYGVDIIAGRGNGGDTNGHGTHVAGIIAARNNNVGVMGIAYNVKIMSVKAAMHNGTLNQADIAKAVLYAYENGAEVINMSFGGSACSIAVQDALATAYTRCVLVASAGNNGYPNEPADYYPIPLPNYPAALTYVLGVMSVNEAGIESAFTNWDTKAFNGVEYELYAPGENIMSTLPGNKYGYLSGTSMAAPVVSAFAAILRSEFSDRDKYPTKFIYGQLSSTSEHYADCVNPKMHLVGGFLHNLPQIADLNAALTKLPKPEVNLQEYYLFDDPKYSKNNNGDGVIDAGETIALGLVLRNRWGMSENTLVTIDTLSDISGMADPYFTIKNPSVDYGSVGTYSTQDCGRIYSDELLTGWEKPFLIEVSPDCPNDYRFTLNVTITCENALDEADTTVYSSKGKVNENVRAGFILPSIIDEDMVLTPENLYIIPNATIITEGTTVKVMPGTHIQFWSDDANDPYADSYIAYLLVNGQFLVEGTKEKPVYIYPSQLMDYYNVEMGSSSKGYISLKYADITNFAVCENNTGTYNNIDLADHCTFRNTYGDYIGYRCLRGGVVYSYYTSSPSIGYINAKDSVFYKLGLDGGQYIYGNFDRCIFNQCGIRFGNEIYINGRYVYSSYKNCVFLGNDFIDQTRPDDHQNSSMAVYKYADQPSVDAVYYRPETGTTYLEVRSANGLEQKFLAETLDMETVPYVILESAEEGQTLARIRYPDGQYGSGYSSYYDVGIRYDPESEEYVWSDGSAVDSWLDPDGLMAKENQKLYLRLSKNNKYDENGNYAYENGRRVYEYGCKLSTSSGGCLYEVPGPILPTDITFAEYAVDMDTETTYQLQPQNTPVQLPVDQFFYESDDETVVTVDHKGLVTPVGQGTADVWVWSLDRAIKNRVTFAVKDYVPLEDLAFPMESAKLEMGTSISAKCILTPADTTRRSVTYTSSDPSVVTVKNGVLTAVGKGSATITATCEDLTATMEVSTWVRATSLRYKEYEHYRTVESGDTSLPELTAYPANADLDLQWRSNDPSVVTVENGKLVAKKAGNTLVYATDRNSGKEVGFRFYVTSSAPVIGDDVIAVQLGAEPMPIPDLTWAEGAEATPVWQILDPAVAELRDGEIVFNGAGMTTLRVTDPRNGLTDEIFLYVTEGEVPGIKELISLNNGYYLALMTDGSLYRWHAEQYEKTAPQLVCKNVKAVGTQYDYSYEYYSVLLEDNTVVTYYYDKRPTYWVSDNNGVHVPVPPVVLPEGVEAADLAGYYYSYKEYGYGELQEYGTMHVLTEDGKVYAIGSNNYGMLGIGTTNRASQLTQVKLNEKVVQIAHDNFDVTYYLTEKGNLYISGGSTLQVATPVMIARNVTWLDDHGRWFVANDRLYRFMAGDTEPEDMGYDYTGYTVLDMNSYNNDKEGVAFKDGELWKIYDGGRPYCKVTALQGAVDGSYRDYNGTYYYAVTEDGMLFGYGYNQSHYNNSWDNPSNAFLGMTDKMEVKDRPLFLPIIRPTENLEVLETNLDENGVLTEETLNIRFNKQLLDAMVTISENDTAMVVHKEIHGELLLAEPTIGLLDGAKYTLTVTASGTTAVGLVKPAEDIVIEFTYQAPVAQQPEQTIPEEETTPKDEVTPDVDVPAEPEKEPVVYEAILDETIQRHWTTETLSQKATEWNKENQLNGYFYGNAILNPISTDFEVSHWLRLQAPDVTVGEYEELALSGNYWGSVNDRAIGLQMIDYTDFPNYARFMYNPILTEAPENTFPFVTSVKLFNKYGEEVTTVGNEEVTFQVKFNRDMDTSIDLLVRFGSAFPYGDYEIAGQYVDARTWEGTYTLNTLIENGYQYFSISNGCSATEDLPLQWDQYRFFFEIDTTAAQALLMQGTATDTGIALTWTQDDFQTLMGYNVYRSTKEDGLYTRLNKTVIPADTMEWFDDTVEPGVVYYYNFTVVQTDMAESEPSGKIVIMSKDTMAPNIYHSPVVSAFTGSNLVLTATVTDNLNIAYANLYYRVTGTEEWSTIRMNQLNDKYSAIIPAAAVTVEGIEYYIEAFDGISYTYKGSAQTPFTIAVQEALDENSLGDVDGDGVITNLDALLLLYTINDKYNMTAEQFARADLNGDGELWAAEALRILQYVSGVIGSVKM